VDVDIPMRAKQGRAKYFIHPLLNPMVILQPLLDIFVRIKSAPRVLSAAQGRNVRHRVARVLIRFADARGAPYSKTVLKIRIANRGSAEKPL
jgi:hypothetical protein